MLCSFAHCCQFYKHFIMFENSGSFETIELPKIPLHSSLLPEFCLGVPQSYFGSRQLELYLACFECLYFRAIGLSHFHPFPLPVFTLHRVCVQYQAVVLFSIVRGDLNSFWAEGFKCLQLCILSS